MSSAAVANDPPTPKDWDGASLPNFLLLGAAKAGTSTLAAMLADHSQIFIPSVKELGFFSIHEVWARGLDDYRRAFSEAMQDRAVVARGEATPSYLCSPSATQRAASIVPPASQRFVVLLRDPVARAYSHYLHMQRTGAEQQDFRTAVRDDAERCAADTVGAYNGCYAYGSRYALHLERWQAAFPKGQFLILLMDDLVAEPAETVRRVYEFLGVDADCPVVLRHENPGGSSRLGLFRRVMNSPEWMKRGWDRALSPRTKQRLGLILLRIDRKQSATAPLDPAFDAELRSVFAQDIDYVERITGRDLTTWRTGHHENV